MDHPILSNSSVGDWKTFDGTSKHAVGLDSLPNILQELKEVAIETNKEWAEKLGIPQSTAITCVKPSGTVSQLVNSASGIHTRFAHYYIRRVRGDNHDPITQFLIKEGVPNEPEISKEGSTTVFSFPQKAPQSSVTRSSLGAIEQLNLWKIYQDNWCEHKPSITVYVKEEEWMEVGAWVYNHFDDTSGISFLPYSDHVYQQAPYEEISQEEYDVLKNSMPSIQWTELRNFEDDDYTTGINELACTGGACDI
jgi:ribonucleoside-diphosphate reductase alpha chain